MATVSEFVIERMQAWGVHRVFGYPGDGIGEFDGILGKTDREGTRCRRRSPPSTAPTRSSRS